MDTGGPRDDGIRVERVDDYQCWLLEGGGARVLVDPWLVGTVRIGPFGLLFRRVHGATPAYTPETLPRLSGIVVTAHFGDHLIPETLRALTDRPPVWTTETAAPRVRRLGYEEVEVVRPGGQIHVPPIPGAEGVGLTLDVIPSAAPYETSAFGLWARTAGRSGGGVYLETHVADDEVLDGRLPNDLDGAILPVEGVTVFGTRYAMGRDRVLEVLGRLAPGALLPTGTDPGRAGGLLPGRLMACERLAPDALPRLVGAARPEVDVVVLGPGEAWTPSSVTR